MLAQNRCSRLIDLPAAYLDCSTMRDLTLERLSEATRYQTQRSERGSRQQIGTRVKSTMAVS